MENTEREIATPIVDNLIFTLDSNHEVNICFVWRQMVNLARTLERENCNLKNRDHSANSKDTVVLPSGLAERILECCWSATSKLDSQISRVDAPIGYVTIVKDSFRVLNELQGMMRGQEHE